MYAGFELKNLKEECFKNFEKYFQLGKRDFKKQKQKIKNKLDEFIINGRIDGNKMQSAWFPQIYADVFLTHSHADENSVIAFAGWLKDVFEINVFIDSCIWGYSMDLQKNLDEEYSKIKDHLYQYDNVLYASSHVHMILNTALMQKIDNCECIIFVNTPNSVKPGDVIDKVVSPWIYSEIGMTKLIRKKSINEHRSKVLFESKKGFSDLEIEYNLDTDHLIQLTIDDLNNWDSRYKNSKREISRLKKFNEEAKKESLDYLYEVKK